MRGRTQAAVVAMAGHWIPLLTPAAVALVTLRRGFSDGLWVLLWGLLPAVVLLAMQHPGALLAISGAVSVWAGALLLRRAASWRHTLMGLVACNTLGSLVLALVFPDLVAALVTAVSEMFRTLQTSQSLGLPEPDTTLVLGLMAAMTSFSSMIGLILGRWWQSLLYNPGGFAGEFRALRLGPLEALVCVGAAAYCYWQPVSYSMWQVVFTLPLLFAGIALVHWLVAARKQSDWWLVIFYAALVLVMPLMNLLVAFAFVDTWLNIRGRVAPKS